MIAGLTEALASRRAIVDQEAETAEGYGSGTAGPVARGSKFAGVSFVEKSATGKTGLVNQGATCYLNSFVQMLCMTPDFCKPLFEWQHDPEQHGEERRCLALQLQKLLARLHLTSRGAVATTDLTKSFGWEGSEAFVQHDIQECMMHVMDHLATMAAGTSLGRHVSVDQRGRMPRYVLCHGCGFLSLSEDRFASVQVPIKGCKDLEDALGSMIMPEVLCGSNQYSCQGCSSMQDASLGRYFDGAELPLMLTMQLVRFDFDLTTLRRVKLSDSVPFPETLDMASFLRPPAAVEEQAAAAGSPDAFAIAKEAADAAASSAGGAQYELLAVMMHTGGAHGGHYFAYIKDIEAREASSPPAATHSWIRFNDSTVREMSAEEMRRAFGGTKEEPWDPRAATCAKEIAEAAMDPPVSSGSITHGDASVTKTATDPDALVQSVAGASEATAKAASISSSCGSASANASAKSGKQSTLVAAAASNAYMLVYRRVPTHTPVPIVPASAVPNAMREGIEAENAEFAHLREEWLWEKDLIQSKVFLPEGSLAAAASASTSSPGGLPDGTEPLAGSLSAAEALKGSSASSSTSSSPAGSDASLKATGQHTQSTSDARSSAFVVHASKSVDDATVLAAACLGLLDPAIAPDSGAVRPATDGSSPSTGADAVAVASASAIAAAADAGHASSGFEMASREECLRRCRLRFMDSLKGIMLAPLEHGVRAEGESAPPALKDLDEVPESHRTLALELRADTDAPWPSWSAGSVAFKALLFRAAPSSSGTDEGPVRGSFDPPKQVTVPTDSLAALRSRVEDSFALHGRCRLVHMRGDTAVVLAESDEASVSLRKDLQMLPGDFVYVDPTTDGDSPVVALLEGVANTVAVDFQPLKPLTPDDITQLIAEGAIATHQDVSGEVIATDCKSINIDQRCTLRELREALHEATGATPGTIRVLRPPSGPELKGDDKLLSFFGLVGGGKVVLRRGRPLQPDEYTVKITFFTPPAAAAAEAEAEAKVGALTSGAAVPAPAPARGGRPGRPAAGVRPARGGPRPARGSAGASSGAGPRPARARAPGAALAAKNRKFRLLGRLVTSKTTPVPDLKRAIAARLRTPSGETMDASLIRLRSRTGQTLGDVLLDCREVGKALTSRLVDDREIVVQAIPAAEMLDEGSLLLALRQWAPRQAVLQPAGPEWAVHSTMTYAALRDLIAERTGIPRDAVVLARASQFMLSNAKAIANLVYFGQSPESDSGAAPSASASADSKDDSATLAAIASGVSGADSVRFGKRQPADTAVLAAEPWRLRSGSVVLFKDGREPETARADDKALSAGGAGSGSSARTAGQRAEVGFKIFTPQQQREREEERKRKAKEAKEAMEEAAAAAQKRLDEAGEASKAEHEGVDLRPYTRLLRGGVTYEGVERKMESDGVNAAILMPRVVAIVAGDELEPVSDDS